MFNKVSAALSNHTVRSTCVIQQEERQEAGGNAFKHCCIQDRTAPTSADLEITKSIHIQPLTNTHRFWVSMFYVGLCP